MVKFLGALEVVREMLVGEEMTALKMDNKIMEAGFLTTFDGDINEWLNDGNVIAYFDDETFENAIQIFFEVTIEADEDEIPGATYIRITDVQKF